MYIHVKAHPDARRESVEQISTDHFVIHIKEPALRNAANHRIIALLQERYPNSIVRIINGHNSPSKLISLENKE